MKTLTALLALLGFLSIGNSALGIKQQDVGVPRGESLEPDPKADPKDSPSGTTTFSLRPIGGSGLQNGQTHVTEFERRDFEFGYDSVATAGSVRICEEWPAPAAFDLVNMRSSLGLSQQATEWSIKIKPKAGKRSSSLPYKPPYSGDLCEWCRHRHEEKICHVIYCVTVPREVDGIDHWWKFKPLTEEDLKKYLKKP